MTAALILAMGLVAGGDARQLAMAAGAVWMPWPTAVALAVAVVVGRRAERRHREGRELRFLESAVAELRTGASLRRALRSACAGLDDAGRSLRRLEVGEPLDRCLDEVVDRLPSVGALVIDAVSAAGGSSRMVPVLEELMIHLGAEATVQAELRTATAQVRASTWVLVGGPLGYLAWSGWSGRLAEMLALPGGTALAAAGACLFLAGVGVMAVVTRAAR